MTEPRRVEFALELEHDDSRYMAQEVAELLDAHVVALRITAAWYAKGGMGDEPYGTLHLDKTGEQIVPGKGKVIWEVK